MIARWIAQEDHRARHGMIAGFVVGFLIVFSIWGSTSCAASANERARRVAIIQKTAVDGVGGAYLNYCRIVRRPACIDKDEAAAAKGAPQTKEQRVACLKPCDSATAEKIQIGVDLVRTEQTVLFELLRGGSATDGELAAQRQQLQRAVEQVTALLQQTGVLDVIGDVVGGRPQ